MARETQKGSDSLGDTLLVNGRAGIPTQLQPPGLDSSHCPMLSYLQTCFPSPAKVSTQKLLPGFGYTATSPLLCTVRPGEVQTGGQAVFAHAKENASVA